MTGIDLNEAGTLNRAAGASLSLMVKARRPPRVVTAVTDMVAFVPALPKKLVRFCGTPACATMSV
jgi:hypothetical protein